jgi:transposase
MEYYGEIDVSLEISSICVVDAIGRIVREAKVASELEAGPLSQWLYAGMKQASLAIELLETRHVRNAICSAPDGTSPCGSTA